MKEVDVIVKAKAGLHARPASSLVKTASGFKAKISLIKGEKTVDAKRLLSVLTLGAICGDKVKIIAEGLDEEVALEAVLKVIETED